MLLVGAIFRDFSHFFAIFAHFFDFLARLRSKSRFEAIFFDFGSISGGFWVDFGTILEGFFEDF